MKGISLAFCMLYGEFGSMSLGGGMWVREYLSVYLWGNLLFFEIIKFDFFYIVGRVRILSVQREERERESRVLI